MFFSGVVRIGQDAQVTQTRGGIDVANFTAAYDYGRPDPATGSRPTQWLRLAVWGQRGKSLGPHLTTGKWIEVALTDIHVRPYEVNGESRYSLEAKVVELDFLPIGGRRQDGENAQGEHQRSQPAQSPQEQPASNHQERPAPAQAAPPAQSAPPPASHNPGNAGTPASAPEPSTESSAPDPFAPD